MKWQDLAAELKQMKHYFIAAAATLFIGIYLGYNDSGQFQNLLHNQVEQLKDIMKGIMAQDHSQWRLFIYILFNNMMVVLFMMYTGVLFGIIPLFSLLSNGLMLGYMAHGQVASNGWGSFLLGILPHGVIDFPALLLASAYGIRFGGLAFKSLLLFPSPQRRLRNSQRFRGALRASLPLLAVLAAMLLAAALVECFITYNLVKPK